MPQGLLSESGLDSARDISLLYKVPIDQRRANPEAFTPRLYSFGPYHAVSADVDNLVLQYTVGSVQNAVDAEAQLLEGLQVKLNTVRGLLLPDPEIQFEELVNKIEERALEIYAQYKQLHRHYDQKFATMLALDGILIIAATLRPGQQSRTPLISYPLARLVLSDAILLENQVPVLVLETALNSIAKREIIWQSSCSSHNAEGSTNVDQTLQPPSLEDVISWFCQRASPIEYFNSDRKVGSVCHVSEKGAYMRRPLLSFLYDYVVCVDGSASRTKSRIDRQNSAREALRGAGVSSEPSLPTASHLARCGLRFVPNATDEEFIISFDRQRSNLCLPKITVNDTTLRALHNLLAYEATTRHPQEYWLVSYVHFMDCLIDTAHDAQVLINAGVICNKLGSVEELASKWNRLCMSVSCRNTPSDTQVMFQLEALSKHKWRRWRAGFVELYWVRQPWLLVSIVAAFILLVLTILQTVYSVLSYTSPPRSFIYPSPSNN